MRLMDILMELGSNSLKIVSSYSSVYRLNNRFKINWVSIANVQSHGQ